MLANKSNLAINGGKKAVNVEGKHFVWPLITQDTKNAILEQIDTTISIYDGKGVFEDFERLFAHYHGRRFGLVSNSGTSAIFSMFEGINLMPGDEIICPAYTFFATISPIVHTGATPVFCDCKEDGNIDPEEIKRKVTHKTKAVIVTHMWGIPCDMDEIRKICKDYNLFLFEDVSHAHGARYKGKVVGSFGDAAAWSLQGQKIISGGEGGIMLTDKEDIFTRALLQGHYNKRCKLQIADEHPLKQFYLTGFGLKFRPNVMGIAMAKEQFGHLDEWLHWKRLYANEFSDMLKEFSFIRVPNTANREPSWYAYTFGFDFGNTGVPIERFFEALVAEGLAAADRPMSTAPLYNMPLFTRASKAVPRLYKDDFSSGDKFPNADRFFAQAIKLPMWAREIDRDIVNAYKYGLYKSCQAVERGWL